MSAVLAREAVRARLPSRLCLLGTGGVGRAVLLRLQELQARGVARDLQLVAVANSRRVLSATTLLPGEAIEQIETIASITTPDVVETALSAHRGPCRNIVIDATASDLVASRHAPWLAAGIDVVTANKLGAGASLARWRAIIAAQAQGQTRYGDAASVGAGLPVLRSLRSLAAGGDEVLSIAGVLSGSLAWLLHHFDGSQDFSDLVRAARARGLTEPDPREDLAGADVCRKLLILVRTAGFALEARDVRVTPLLDAVLAHVDSADLDATLSRLDAPMLQHLERARRQGRTLHCIARWQSGCVSVGLEALDAQDPLAGGSACDNRVVIHSSRYRERPLLIQGPGAGNEITAAALLDDALEIAGLVPR